MRVKELLQRALSTSRLAQAYLFSGPEGVGKEAAAIELAKTVNCRGKAAEACDGCPDCVKFRTLQHPNVHLIFPMPLGKNEGPGDGPVDKLSRETIGLLQAQIRLKAENPYHTILLPDTNTIKVASIREVRRVSSMTAYGGGRKVFIIMSADMMNPESSNALLKTLEEPHEDTLFILTTERPDDLLATVTSRCQQIRFDRLSEEEIARALGEREGVDRERSGLIARVANGSYERARSLVSSGTDERRDEAVEFLRTALYRPRAELLRSIEEIASRDERQEIEEFLSLLMTWLRDAMLLGESPGAVINSDNTDALLKFSLVNPALRYDELFAAIERSISLLNKNVYIPLILQDLALRMRGIIIQPKGLAR